MEGGGGEQHVKFATHTLPGGENYRELLLTLPPRPKYSPEIIKGIRDWEDFVDRIDDKYEIDVTGFWGFGGASSPLTAKEMMEMQALREQLPVDFDVYADTGSSGMDDFSSGHWDEPNVLAHVRFNERTVAPRFPNNHFERVLFIEEMQSDWHAKGRKQGYIDPANVGKIEVFDPTTGRVVKAFDTNEQARDFIREVGNSSDLTEQHGLPAGVANRLDYAPAGQGNVRGGQMVPDAPFKGSWHELAFRRMVRYAAENDFDRIAWITGEQTADRYDLSKHLAAIDVIKNEDGFFVQGFPNDFYADHVGPTIRKQVADEEELANTIGKELADRVIKKGNEGRFESGVPVQLRGLDIKIGGEWAVNLYDRTLQNYARKFGKKFGAEVEDVDVDQGTPNVIDITRNKDLDEIDLNRVFVGWNVVFSDGTNVNVLARTREEAGPQAIKDTYGVPKEGGTIVHSMTITDKMSETAMKKGFPLFSAGGLVAGAGFAGLEAGREDGEEIQMESILEPSLEGPRIVKAYGGFIDKPLYERTL